MSNIKKRVGKAPRLLPNVLDAIASLKEKQGSTQKQIVGQIADGLKINKDGTRNVTLMVKRALDHGIHSGLLKQKSGKYALVLGKQDYAVFKRFKKSDEPCEDCNACKRGRKRGRSGGRGRKRRSSRRRRGRRRNNSSNADDDTDDTASGRSETAGTYLMMDEALEALILAGANENAIEYVILHNILGVEQDQEVLQGPNFEFDLDNMQEKDVKNNFRFEREDIYRLAEALRIPEAIHTSTRNSVRGVTGLCILLKRLAYPGRLKDIQPLFNLSAQSLSQIINHMISLISEQHMHLLQDLRNLNWLNLQRMETYAEVVRAKGGAVQNCWGFIDGTARSICRPSIDQEEYYSGHKRVHCLKFQSVLCPDGIITSFKGAFPGRNHDARLLRESNLYAELEQVAVFPNDQKFVLYGDQAYGIRELLLCPFPTRQDGLPQYQQQFNNSMKVIRASVEWGFQKIISQFAFLDLKKNQKLLLQDLERTPEPMDRSRRRRRRKGSKSRRRGRRGRRRTASKEQIRTSSGESSESAHKESNSATPPKKRKSDQIKTESASKSGSYNTNNHPDRNTEGNHQDRTHDQEEDDLEHCGNLECLCYIKQDDDSPRCISNENNYYTESYLN